MGECHHAPSPRRALEIPRKLSHNVLNKLSQRRRFTQKRTMAGVQLPAEAVVFWSEGLQEVVPA